MAPYIIITPAHNEEAFIALTAEAVVAQTVRPLRWIVVNDGSTDGTADIVARFCAEHDFIRLVHLVRPPGRHFGHKVQAFNAGLREANDLGYEFVGNLDADISVRSKYFATILARFERDPRLGLAGGMVHTWRGAAHVSTEVALDSVAGAVQLFRRQCFEEIGGYVGMPNGGIDAAAEISARMRGWRTRTFPDCPALEHRFTGSATAGPLVSRLKEGRRMYSLGYSPSFYGCRCAYRVMDAPPVLGSVAALCGFLVSMLRRRPILMPPDVVRFLRAEQREKLKQVVRRSVLMRRLAPSQLDSH